MSCTARNAFTAAGLLMLLGLATSPLASAVDNKPNILVIMGNDVGWFNVGAYHQGIMSGKTPNLDKLAAGMRFTDYYAEASCTAGRANFITGEIPLRTGLTTVGQAGADVGIPEQAATIALALKAQGYETFQFGKNHLGDLTSISLACTVSTNSSATCTTSMRCQIPTGSTTRRIGSTKPGRARFARLPICAQDTQFLPEIDALSH